MDASRRILAVILIAMFSMYLVRVLVHGGREIAEVNDFEVFHHIGGVAADHDPSIYDVVTPVKQRGPFLYPPSAAVLFVPLSWLSHDAAGILFSALKTLCLILLYWGSVRFSGIPPRDMLGTLVLMLVPAVLAHRAVDSDVGNGQVNIVVAAAAVGGVWLMMLSRRGWWLGAALLAWAIAVKLTPALLLAVPLLHRRWKGFIVATAMTASLFFALPAIWFGPANFGDLLAKHREITGRFTLDAPALGRQVSLHEFIQFTRVQIRGDLNRDGAFDDPDESPVITGQSGANLLNPALRRSTATTWLVVSAGVGVAFLLVRAFLLRSGVADWTWDLAMMCVMTVFISPRVHKAHLVILIVPAGWIAARLLHWVQAGAAQRSGAALAALVIAVAMMVAMLLIMENLPVPLPFPGAPDPPYHCLAFFGLLLMMAMLVALGRRAPLPLGTS